MNGIGHINSCSAALARTGFGSDKEGTSPAATCTLQSSFFQSERERERSEDYCRHKWKHGTDAASERGRKKKMGGGNFFKKKCRGGRRDSWVELECGRFHGPTGRHPRENEVGEESEMAHVFGAVQEPGPCGTRWGSVLQSTHVRRHKPMPILGGRVRVGDGMNHWSPRPWEATRTAPQAFGGAPVIWSRRGAVLVPHVWTPPPLANQAMHMHRWSTSTKGKASAHVLSEDAATRIQHQQEGRC